MSALVLSLLNLEWAAKRADAPLVSQAPTRKPHRCTARTCRPSVPSTTPHRCALRAASMAARRAARIPSWSYSSRVRIRPYGSYLLRAGRVQTYG